MTYPINYLSVRQNLTEFNSLQVDESPHLDDEEFCRYCVWLFRQIWILNPVNFWFAADDVRTWSSQRSRLYSLVRTVAENGIVFADPWNDPLMLMSENN